MTKLSNRDVFDDLIAILAQFGKALQAAHMTAMDIDNLMTMFSARRELWKAIVPPAEASESPRPVALVAQGAL